MAREWYAKFSPAWAEHHAKKTLRFLERDAFPRVGTKPMVEITALQLLAMLRRIESRGTLEAAHRVHQTIGRVFRYAIATGRAERDPAADLRGALPPVKQAHHASITNPKRIRELLRAIADCDGSTNSSPAARPVGVPDLRRTAYAAASEEGASCRNGNEG